MNKQLIGYNIVSPLHLINFLAYWLSNKDIYNKVIVFIDYYWGYNIIPEKYLNFCKMNNIEIYFNCDNKEKMICCNENIISDMIFVNSIVVKILLKYKKKICKVIIVDEGLSTYAGFNNWKKAVKREQKIDVYFLPYLFKKIIKKLTEKVLYRDCMIDFRSFSMKNCTMQDKYRVAIHDLFSFMYADHIKMQQENDLIVFCSQPLVDLNIMTEMEFSSYLLKIQDKVRKQGFSLVIKKHPAEKKFDYEKYGLTVLNYDGMLEEYAFLHPMRGIISATSTSSLLVPALYGIDSFIMDYKMVNELGKIAKMIFFKYTKSLEEL